MHQRIITSPSIVPETSHSKIRKIEMLLDPRVLEEQRLLGSLIQEQISSDLSLQSIVSTLGSDHSQDLLSELYANYPEQFANGHQLSNCLSSVKNSLLRSYLRALLARGVSEPQIQLEYDKLSQEKSRIRLAAAKRLSICESPNFVPVYRVADSVTINIPGFRIVHSDLLLPAQGNWLQTLPAMNIFEISNLHVVCGSQVFLDPNSQTPYLDSAGSIGAWSTDYRHDFSLFGVARDEVLIRVPRDRGAAEQKLSGHLWLGLPLSTAWGHWFQEFLTRIAIFSLRMCDVPLRVAIPSNTPKGFIDFAKFLWPAATFTLIPEGTWLQLKNCFYVNDRMCSAHGVFPSFYGHLQHLTCEPIGMRALRDVARSRARDLPHSFKVPQRVFLSRQSSSNGRSNLDARLSHLAGKYGYISVDPSSLDVRQEIGLGLGMSRVAGLAGSQMLISLFADSGLALNAVGHDLFDHDSRGHAWAFSELQGGVPVAVLGYRPNGSFVRSERGMHRDFLLSEDGFMKFEETLAITS
jgi:hypothetical protein